MRKQTGPVTKQMVEFHQAPMSITEFQIVDKSPSPPWKDRVLKLLSSDLALFIFFIIFMIVSFLLGYLTGQEGRGLLGQEESDVVITESMTEASVAPQGQTAEATASTATDQKVVASKNGTRYYFPWCGGVSRINPENLVSFPSVEAAERAGLSLASGCQ